MKKILALFLALVLVVSFVLTEGSSHISATTENPTPIAEYNFDNDNGTTVTDSKGSYKGTANGTKLVDGPEGKVRSFNGTSDYIDFNKPVIPSDKQSIKFKIKTSSKKELAAILSQTNGTEDFGTSVFLNNGKIKYVNSNGNKNSTWNFDIISNKSVNDGEWHDILVVWDGTTKSDAVKIYIDDFSKPDITGNARKAVEKGTSNLRIGRKAVTKDVATSYYFEGQLDSIQIFNDVIEPSKEQHTSKSKLYVGNKSFYKLTSNGEVYAWGENSYGQLGLGDTSKRTLSKKEKINLPEKVTDISVGQNFVIALGESGKVYGWGDNSSGVLSDEIGSIKSPVEVESEISEIVSED
ncbi:hypothetical protein C2I06_10310 [Niallia circulans]|uniref:LamG-like jellyroll fold domain-containing protein n=1 Tax=Niallia circulans TaxID=1397 RepID=UPI000F45B85A|nr:LamG-like jellyroll fold domain-containing protein [Niallia circulans]AYV67239.1 hypothetical protein C2I06_10310 [Niallia circulans]